MAMMMNLTGKSMFNDYDDDAYDNSDDNSNSDDTDDADDEAEQENDDDNDDKNDNDVFEPVKVCMTTERFCVTRIRRNSIIGMITP